jgi:adenylate cyclase
VTAPGPRILVVDDTPNNVKLLRDLLELKGYRVDTAGNGTDALRSVGNAMPDLVLLDIIMPDMSGYDVCRAIRARPDCQGLPVVLVTSLNASDERIKGLDAGADDFITKPIHQPELLARVRSLLRIKTLHDTVERQAAVLRESNATLENRVREQLEQLERLAQLKRFFPQHVAERIVAGELADPRRTRRKEVTIAFADIRGFTAFTDGAEPEEVIELLCEHHARMGRIVVDHGGALVYFAGDGMMIVFNDPVEIDAPAERAVAMAAAMRESFEVLETRWRRRGHEVGLGIGIAHGYATIGAIGVADRMDYSVIGRVVILASRLCAEAKAGQILVSSHVATLVEQRVAVAFHADVSLKGFHKAVPIFAVQGTPR